jgi:penicillin amidase
MKSRFRLLAGLIAVGGLAIAGLRHLYRRPLPQVNGTVKLKGLCAPVEVIRDRWGVPHIYAQNMDDLLCAQGYVHAQDRLWQMELNRRIGHGRLSELFGALAFETDRFLRIIGLSRAAHNDLHHLDARTRAALNHYARGVNTYIEQANAAKKLPLEFLLLRHTPEPWQPADTLVFSKLMAWSLSCNWDSEILQAALIGKVGPERAMRLKGEYDAANPLIIPQQTYAQVAESVLAQFREMATLPLGAMGSMSNSWVVAGAKTTTGKPLLANDPHLALQMPSIWYENHLIVSSQERILRRASRAQDAKPSNEGFEVTGVSFPGSPLVVIGHNQHIAWGFTNAFPDAQDLYLEKFNPDNPNEYEFMGQWEKATVLREEICVKGELAPRVVEVIVTRHGPIINQLTPLTANGQSAQSLALRWTAHEPSDIVRAIEGINRATNWRDFCEAVRAWDVPSQNMVYADCEGNIGYYMPGRVPIRKKGVGATPVPGWTGEYEWQGYIPHEELPHAFNPAPHFIATANNQVAGKEYPHFLTSETMNGYRARRIVDLLTETEKLSADDFARMQTDVYCIPAKEFCQLLLTLKPKNERAKRALTIIKAWDYHLTKDTIAGALYELTRYFALRQIFDVWLGELAPHFIGVGFHPLLAPMTSYQDRCFVTLQRVLLNDESDWFKGRTREEILAAAFEDAIHYLRTAVGEDMSQWTWGRIHQAGFNHALGAVKPLDKIFNRGPYPYGGDTNTVWQAAYVPQLPINTNGGSASWRQIIDVSDWDASRAVHTTGQSGHPASAHYDDMIPLWLNGEYHPLLWSREKVEANAEGRLILEPSSTHQGS